MTEKPCAKCHLAPRKPNDSYCIECRRAIVRDWARRTHGSKPRKLPPRPLESHEKFCPRCERILHRDRFCKERKARDGVNSICKGCDAHRTANYRIRNRRKLRPKQRVRSAAFRAKNPGYNARACRIYSLRRKERLLTEVMERHSFIVNAKDIASANPDDFED